MGICEEKVLFSGNGLGQMYSVHCYMLSIATSFHGRQKECPVRSRSQGKKETSGRSDDIVTMKLLRCLFVSSSLKFILENLLKRVLPRARCF